MSHQFLVAQGPESTGICLACWGTFLDLALINSTTPSRSQVPSRGRLLPPHHGCPPSSWFVLCWFGGVDSIFSEEHCSPCDTAELATGLCRTWHLFGGSPGSSSALFGHQLAVTLLLPLAATEPHPHGHSPSQGVSGFLSQGRPSLTPSLSAPPILAFSRPFWWI